MIGRARLRRQGLTLPNWLGLRVLLIDPLHGMREARIVRDASLPAPVTREVLAELRIRGWAVIDQPDGPYRLTTSGLERAQDAARAVDTPWKLSCRIRGRCNRARARARAHDFAVADALTIALDLARRLADTYVSSPAR